MSSHSRISFKRLFFLLAAAMATAAGAETIRLSLHPGIPEDWKLTGPAAGVSNILQSSQKIDGELPILVRYSFKTEQNDYVFLERNLPLPGKPRRVKGSIFSDGSGNTIRMNFTDASGEFHQALVAQADWTGWKEVDTDLILGSHWGGDGNGVMDGGLTFHSWVINSEPQSSKTRGSIGFAKMVIDTEPDPKSGAGSKGPTLPELTIDDFERPNPLAVYQVWRGDDSSIESVSSTEHKKEGNYSMQVTYTLSTGRSLPSWVSWSFAPQHPMDWARAEDLRFYFKGDGTKNTLQVSLTDESGKVWVYKFDGALTAVDWNLLTAPLSRFADAGGKARLTPGKVKQYEFAIVGESAQVSSGKIWLDQFTLRGQGLDALVSSPRVPVSEEVIEKSKIGFGDFAHLEYRQSPELNQQFLYYNSLYVRASAKKLSLAADVVSRQNEAGTSIGFRTPLERTTGEPSSPTEVTESRSVLELAFLNATLHDLHPHLSQLTLGNITVDYGRDVFSPVFGFKGAEAEGLISPAHYDAFIIKHAFDAVTFGYRFQLNWYDTLLKYEMVRHRDTAKTLANARLQDGQLVVSSDNELKTDSVGNDTVYFFEADRDIWDRLNLNLNYGMDFFDRAAIKDVTDPFNPVIDQRLEVPESLYGRMYQARLKLLPGLVNRGLTFIASYRDLSAEFKPRFRFSPKYYDDFFADQRGYKFELTQIIGRFKFTGVYDDVDRGSKASGYYRRYFQGSLGYYSWNRMDVVLSYNRRREFYALADNHLRSTFYINPADPRNEQADTYELFLGNWFSGSFYVWGKLRYDDIQLANTSRRLRNDSVQFQGEYAPVSNAKLILSVIQTRYNDSTSEPFGGDPPSDNIVRLFLDINF